MEHCLCIEQVNRFISGLSQGVLNMCIDKINVTFGFKDYSQVPFRFNKGCHFRWNFDPHTTMNIFKICHCRLGR